MKNYSNSSKAIAWRLAYGKTQAEAASKFMISQGSISSTEGRENYAIRYCESVPELTRQARDYLKEDPTRSARGIAFTLKLDDVQARTLALGIHTMELREEYRMQAADATLDDMTDEFEAGARHGYRRGRVATVKECATLARMVGGEAGEGIAQAIEALQ